MICFEESSSVDEGVTFRIRSFAIQTPLGARLSFGIQPLYETPADLRVEISKHSD